MAALPDRPASVVLLGYGLAGRVFHAPLVETTPGLLLDAIVTSDPERQRHAAAAYPAAVIYDHPDQAWASGHDLAVIATPNRTHVDFTRSALDAGLHVVLDKPIAPTAEAARDLADLAASRDLLLVPFQNRRWDSTFLTARQVADRGDIGHVHRFDSHFEYMRVRPKPGWRGSPNPEDMGGLLYDLGAHLVDQALRLMGPAVAVFARQRVVRPDTTTDDDVVVVITHESGAISTLTVSHISAFQTPRVTLFGTRGGLRIDAADSQEATLASGAVPGEGRWGREPEGTSAILRTFDESSQVTESALPLVDGDWPAFYRGVAAAMRGEQDAPVLVADVIADLRVLDAARESARTNAVVTLVPPAAHH